MKLHSKSLGEGPALVILHGLFGSLDNWMTLAKAFSADFTVHLIDQRNHGRSPHSEEWSYEVMAHDLKEWMDDHGVAQAHVLGHSMGGKAAMQFAHFFPEKVDKLVVADIAPRVYPPHHDQILAGMAAVPLATLTNRNEAEEVLTSYIPDPGTRQLLLKALTKEGDGYQWRFNLNVLKAQYERVLEKPDFHIPFDKPALFIHGSASNYVRETDKEEICHWFPHTTFHSMEGASHWLHAEAPEAFYEAVKAFLLS